MSKHNLALAGAVVEIDYPESDGKPMAETDVHRDLITELIETLKVWFQPEAEVYVSGNIMFYYEKGRPQKCVSPDVLVVRGVSKELRRTYKLWEEGQVPEVIFEISSRKTWGDDSYLKLQLYARLGVKEYYLFDPEYDYLPEPLLAFQLTDGAYKKVKVKKHRVFSAALGLELVDTGKTLRLFDPTAEKFLPTLAEETLAREQAEIRAETAEAEIARLRAELARLQNR